MHFLCDKLECTSCRAFELTGLEGPHLHDQSADLSCPYQHIACYWGIPVLGQGSKLNATGVAYAETKVREELSTLLASVDSKISGA